MVKLVFKHNHKLIDHCSPIPDWHGPFLRGFPDGQEDRLEDGIIGRIRHFVFGVFADFSVKIFNYIGRVDNLSDFEWEGKKGSQFFPIGPPALDGVPIFCPPLFLQVVQSSGCRIAIGCVVNLFHVTGERLAVFPTHILTGVSDLVYNADLFGGFGKHGTNCIGKPFEIIRYRDQDIVNPPGL